MKKFYIIGVLLLLCMICDGQIKRIEADSIVNIYIKDVGINQNSWLYVNDSISDNTTHSIMTYYGEIEPAKSPSWTYFIDEVPRAGWAHDCRFVFVDKATGEITDINSNCPPINLGSWDVLSERPIIPEGRKLDFSKFRSIKQKSVSMQSNKYAVIINGGIDKNRNWIRYWNDCSAMYDALVRFYGYQDSNIFVLMSDGDNPADDLIYNDLTYGSSGLDLDNDGDDDIQYSATKQNITTVFDYLSGVIGPDDYLFIFTIDHGHSENNLTYLDLWGGTKISDVEFAIEVDKVNAAEVCIVMGQCYSGGFIDNLEGEGRVIVTACTANQLSWARQPNENYDEFVYNWVTAVADFNQNGIGNPNADTNSDGYVSMKEAFDYAYNNDAFVIGIYNNYYQQVVYETPQYSSTKYTLGDNLTLMGKEICITTDYVSNQTINTHTEIEDCTIEVDNVTVNNGASLELNAENSVIINSNFILELGSELEVNP